MSPQIKNNNKMSSEIISSPLSSSEVLSLLFFYIYIINKEKWSQCFPWIVSYTSKNSRVTNCNGSSPTNELVQFLKPSEWAVTMIYHHGLKTIHVLPPPPGKQITQQFFRVFSLIYQTWFILFLPNPIYPLQMKIRLLSVLKWVLLFWANSHSWFVFIY